MPRQSSAGNLSAKFNKLKSEQIEIDYGFSELPAGIEGGVAEIVGLKIGVHGDNTQNPGKEFFQLQGVVVQPAEHEGRSIYGESFNFPYEPLYDTPTRKNRPSEEEHVAYVIGQLQDLGLTTDDFKDLYESLKNGEVAEALLPMRPHAKFRTWKGEPTKEFPNPRINVEYKGGVSGDAVDTPPPSSSVDDETPDEEPEEEESEDEEDLEAMVAEAEKNSDGPVAKQLKKLAKEAGVDMDAFENAAWDEVPALIREARGGEEEEEEEEEGNVVSFDEIWFYTPKGSKKKIDCHVRAAAAEDLDTWGKKADEDDEEAQEILRAIGEEMDVEETEAWSDWATAIGEAMEEGTVILQQVDAPNKVFANVDPNVLSEN